MLASHTRIAPLWIHQGAHASGSKQPDCCCRYLRDAKDLQKYAASLHLMPEPPDAIAVHNLAALVHATRCAARLCYACGAPRCCRRKLNDTVCHSHHSLLFSHHMPSTCSAHPARSRVPPGLSLAALLQGCHHSYAAPVEQHHIWYTSHASQIAGRWRRHVSRCVLAPAGWSKSARGTSSCARAWRT